MQKPVTTYAKARDGQRTREHDARGSSAAPTLCDDLHNAIWRGLTYAIVPAILLVAIAQPAVNRAKFKAQLREIHPQTQNTIKTPDGFGAELSHGGENDPPKQES